MTVLLCKISSLANTPVMQAVVVVVVVSYSSCQTFRVRGHAKVLEP